jgi:glycosyltransferase involved in cell wall biosynthesis
MPHNKRIVLFAANYLENYRKGMDILISSMELLSGEKDLIFYAAGKRNQKAAGGVLSLGNITDERMMAVAYNAVDVCVVPSREDNLPNTIGESISCGTPVVGFRRGGIPEMIEDGVNGVLVDEVSALALAQGIRRSLSIAWNKNSISLSARGKYSRSVVAHSHAEAYRSASAEKRL